MRGRHQPTGQAQRSREGRRECQPSTALSAFCFLICPDASRRLPSDTGRTWAMKVHLLCFLNYEPKETPSHRLRQCSLTEMRTLNTMENVVCLCLVQHLCANSRVIWPCTSDLASSSPPCWFLGSHAGFLLFCSQTPSSRAVAGQPSGHRTRLLLCPWLSHP